MSSLMLARTLRELWRVFPRAVVAVPPTRDRLSFSWPTASGPHVAGFGAHFVRVESLAALYALLSAFADGAGEEHPTAVAWALDGASRQDLLRYVPEVDVDPAWYLVASDTPLPPRHLRATLHGPALEPFAGRTLCVEVDPVDLLAEARECVTLVVTGTGWGATVGPPETPLDLRTLSGRTQPVACFLTVRVGAVARVRVTLELRVGALVLDCLVVDMSEGMS